MKVSSKVYEINESCPGAGNSSDTVVNVTVRELRNGARVHLEQVVFNVTNKKTSIAGVHASVPSYAFDFKRVVRSQRRNC